MPLIIRPFVCGAGLLGRRWLSEGTVQTWSLAQHMFHGSFDVNPAGVEKRDADLSDVTENQRG